ncbi:MAG: hypothetical protein PUC44_01965 [Eubacteriales bacterium]|nr:hypothetical protein [Eubacteriales bacterium]
MIRKQWVTKSGRRAGGLKAAALLMLCFALAISLASCGKTSQKTEKSEDSSKKSGSIESAYEKVLDNAEDGKYDFTYSDNNGGEANESLTPITDGTKNMEYALQDINGDGNPELFVRQPMSTPSEPTVQWNVRVFTYKSGKKAKELDGVIPLPTGTKSETYDTGLYATSDGKGMYKRTYNVSAPGTPSAPDSTTTFKLFHVTVSGGSVTEEEVDHTVMPTDIGDEIKFTDISDRSGIENLSGDSKGQAKSSKKEKSGFVFLTLAVKSTIIHTCE